MSDWYRLNKDHSISPIDIYAGEMQPHEERVIRQEYVRSIFGKQFVSTVFLGLDHNFGSGPPVLFETMIFGGPDDQEYQERCCTYDQALHMHRQAMLHAFELRNDWRGWCRRWFIDLRNDWRSYDRFMRYAFKVDHDALERSILGMDSMMIGRRVAIAEQGAENE